MSLRVRGANQLPSKLPESSAGVPIEATVGEWPSQVRAHSSNHPQGEPATGGEFLTKQLPTILNKHTAFHIAQHSNQSGDYPNQGPTQLNSSLL